MDQPRSPLSAFRRGCFARISEAYLVSLLSGANLCAAHAKQSTVQPKDMQLVRRLQIGVYVLSHPGSDHPTILERSDDHQEAPESWNPPRPS